MHTTMIIIKFVLCAYLDLSHGMLKLKRETEFQVVSIMISVYEPAFSFADPL